MKTKTPEEIICHVLNLKGKIDEKHMNMTIKIKEAIECIKYAQQQMNGVEQSAGNALPIGTKVVYEGKKMKITNNREEFEGEPAYRCDYKHDELYLRDDFESIF